MKKYSTISAALLLSVSINAQSASHKHEKNTRSLEAHVHGLAAMTVAQEGREIEINLRSPSANIVGFEHKASTSKQIHAVEEAEHTLESGNKMFMFSGTDCQLEHAKVDVSALLDDDHSEHKEHHDDHGHKKESHDEHHEKGHHDDHDEHKDEHAHAEDDHEEHHKKEHHHDHDEHHEETHSEVTVLYHFECDNVKKLSSIKVNLFDHFPGIEKLQTQWVTDNVQGGADLTKDSRTINLN